MPGAPNDFNGFKAEGNRLPKQVMLGEPMGGALAHQAAFMQGNGLKGAAVSFVLAGFNFNKENTTAFLCNEVELTMAVWAGVARQNTASFGAEQTCRPALSPGATVFGSREQTFDQAAEGEPEVSERGVWAHNIRISQR